MICKIVDIRSDAVGVFLRLECRAELLGDWCPTFRKTAVVSHVEVECEMKSSLPHMRLHISEEGSPLALISLTGVFVNFVGY
jgi:hypothetical protein